MTERAAGPASPGGAGSAPSPDTTAPSTDTSPGGRRPERIAWVTAAVGLVVMAVASLAAIGAWQGIGPDVDCAEIGTCAADSTARRVTTGVWIVGALVMLAAIPLSISAVAAAQSAPRPRFRTVAIAAAVTVVFGAMVSGPVGIMAIISPLFMLTCALVVWALITLVLLRLTGPATRPKVHRAVVMLLTPLLLAGVSALLIFVFDAFDTLAGFVYVGLGWGLVVLVVGWLAVTLGSPDGSTDATLEPSR